MCRMCSFWSYDEVTVAMARYLRTFFRSWSPGPRKPTWPFCPRGVIINLTFLAWLAVSRRDGSCDIGCFRGICSQATINALNSALRLLPSQIVGIVFKFNLFTVSLFFITPLLSSVALLIGGQDKLWIFESLVTFLIVRIIPLFSHWNALNLISID